MVTHFHLYVYGLHSSPPVCVFSAGLAVIVEIFLTTTTAIVRAAGSSLLQMIVALRLRAFEGCTQIILERCIMQYIGNRDYPPSTYVHLYTNDECKNAAIKRIIMKCFCLGSKQCLMF